MKTLATAILAYLLFLPATFAGYHEGSAATSTASMAQTAAAAIEASEDSAKKAEVSNETKGLKDKIVGHLVAELTSELENRQELTDEERAKINRLIDGLENMETLADLRRLSDLGVGVKSEHGHPGRHSGSSPEAFIPIVAIIFVFGAPVLIVATVMFINYRKTRLRHATIDKFIESGQQVPADLFATMQSKAATRNGQQKGVMYLFAGIGVSLAALLMHSTGVGALGIIALCIGIAHLLIWKLENKNEG